MRREEKYPNTDVFSFYNANPKKIYTDDCVIRAISVALVQSWSETYVELVNLAFEMSRVLSDDKVYNEYLISKGFKRMSQPRKADNTKYTGKEFCKAGKGKGPMVAHIGGHHMVAIVNNKILDTWDSSDGCIGNYWVKC